MKKLWLALLLTFLSLNVYAGDEPIPAEIPVNGLTMYLLKDFKGSKLGLRVEYPGAISGICTLIMRTDHSHIKRFLNKFKLTYYFSKESPKPSISTPNAAVFSLQKDAYVDGIYMETKDGKSIGENVRAAVGSFDDVGVFAGSCS